MAKQKQKETPLMRQHREIKSKYPDAILLFRVGDFYETFSQDAIIAAKVLGITLTKRANGAATFIELAGFPYHSLDTYLHKLVKAGHRVAICDQLEDPKETKGIVKRGVTEMVTPGVATSDKLLEHNSNNFLAAVHLEEHHGGVAFLDISTGELLVAEGDISYLDKLLQSFQPAEVLVAKPQQKKFKTALGSSYYIFALEDWVYQHAYGYEQLIRHFGTQSLKGFGIEDWSDATIAAGAALHYLKDTEHPNLQHIAGIQRITANTFLWMDRFTIRNLELIHSPAENGYSLLQTIDQSCTPMGARLLKRWLLFPLCDKKQIDERLDAVAFLIKSQDTAQHLHRLMKQVGDIERLVSKIPLRKVNPRELLALGKSLEQCAAILSLLNEELELPQSLKSLSQKIDPLGIITEHIAKTLNAEAPVLLSKGNIIADGVDEGLDELRNIAFKGKDYLLQLQQREAAATGISSLKVGFNNVYGYYLEVTHTHKEKVPEDWIRKQTLTGAERYVTQELKEYETKILNAEEQIAGIELRLYEELIDRLQQHLLPIQQNAKAIAALDCLASMAQQALQQNYCKPSLTNGHTLKIDEGRHPVIEQHMPPGSFFVPNSVMLDKETQQIIIITGPNMSGKSAVLRQTALITLLAHIGSYVPATQAQVPITDKIYTRVGASDNLSGGESTFMVEMNETASILNNLSSRSLIILDEIGRGTSTYDGISLAWSIVEYLHQQRSKPLTLFATHYHELNELESRLQAVKNFHISHKETENKVIFLRKMVAGGSRHSFGIQVAKMAGMPKQLTTRAMELLHLLEDQRGENEDLDRLKKVPVQNYQLNIFDGIGEDLKAIRNTLFDTDINTLTPVEALLKLNELKEIIKNYKA